MKNTMKLILTVFALLVLSAAVMAGTRANPKKGKVYFKKYCRVCHDGNSEVTKLSPMAKTMDQWNKAFAEDGKAHKCADASMAKTQKELSKQDLTDIQAYLVQHAADSDQPATCGN